MPEGDSVWRVARRLDERLAGRQLEHTDFRVPKHATADLRGATVVETDTHGKHLLTRFDNGLTLHTHLRMDGSWTVLRAGRRLPARLVPDIRVRLVTTVGSTAVGLRLPVVELMRTSDENDAIGHLGPDPLRADWDPAEAARRLAVDPERPLVAALLDQRVIAGLGNLWVNELSFLRGYGPWVPVRDIDAEATVRLAAKALQRSASGVTGHQVTTGNTRPGETHFVAGRAGKPCRRCGTTIRVIAEIPGDAERRRTWWCPSCQHGPPPPPTVSRTR